ncbi:GNAT family N-acetyltransferase [Aeromicrobium sp. 636]|uniref:GNAT family N-acetyltransferase n=1 Tax=Aeromicrobium senzhongii TaxID=2663859 RepID=A0A8I0EVD5_9ACTN|nr:GNAT family N-acetyltransferase [Aeromicrobium sp. 636]MBC9225827.1 GNAT family N-acetyltransferase [Aeromicrobium senzhongii]MCQ3997935.1 GNAT family N-acetyltransferase [Aeromicrobium sp. 636]
MDLLGRRVSVRHRDGEGVRDVVGRVLAAGPDGLRIERRDGELAFVPAGTVLAMRVVPDRPRRTRRAASFSAEELTRITSRGWPAVESVPLGDWELRASGGFTGRANSVAVHGDPHTDEPFAAVVDFYTARRLRPLAQLVEGSVWDRRFEAAAWVPVTDQPPGAIVQVANLAAVPAPDPEVVVETHASDAWLRHYGRVSEPATARAVLEGPATVGFLSLDDVAIGRVVVTGEWAGLAAVEVDPAHRRRGLARRIVDTALAWAAARGADKAYLQTMRDNAPALGLYGAYGFTTHHAYRYLTAP